MKGYSIHIGVNKVNQDHYGGLSDLRAAVYDAEDMLKLATESLGYENIAFLTDEKATSKNVLDAFTEANNKSNEGDIVFISYSGHGSTIEDVWRDVAPDELVDQTWCLYDRQLIDDEIKYAFSQFKKNVRILVVSDSCHSGTVVRALDDEANGDNEPIIAGLNTSVSNFCFENNLLSKKVSLEKSTEIQSTHLDFYKEILNNTPNVPDPDNIDASVLLLAACQDDEVTFDGRRNGRFTHSLKYVLKQFQISSPQNLIDKISSYYEYPTPKVTDYGAEIDFRKKGNPFLIIPEIKDIEITEEKEKEDENRMIVPFPAAKKNTIALSSESGELNLNKVNELYDKTILSIPNISTTSIMLELPEDVNIWEAIHEISRNSDKKGYDIIAEPAESKGFESKDFSFTRAPGSEIGFMDYWPPFDRKPTISRNWHLDAEHSQLADARELVWQKIKDLQIQRPVRIGHLDTGWDPNHPLLRENNYIRADLAKSFVDGEEKSNELAEDYVTGKREQQGHGTGTMGLITGGAITYEGEEFGVLGAAPFVELIPIRVTDSVIILKNDKIVKGIEYAIDQNCDVITMSLGGKPSIKMAKAINKAYEKGIVVVAAAGNCIVEGIANLGPKKLVFPAKFDRVIAACGATHNHKPYDFKAQEDKSPFKGFSARFMQGNWGPRKSMKTALAAYTPNVPWLTTLGSRTFVQSGGGTSSATPQIASAAALWLTYFQEELNSLGLQGWKRVEAVRFALFSSASTDYPESEKYYGNGVLKALEALKISPDKIPQLHESKKAKASPFGIIEAIDLFLNRRRSLGLEELSEKELESLQLELTHIVEELNIEELTEVTVAEDEGAIDIEVFGKYRKEILTKNPSSDLIKLLGL